MTEIDPWRFCIAPMMDWTDRHQRYFARLLSGKARLYTEMVTTGALLHGDQPRHLDFHAAEQPLALQLGGSDPDDLATCSRIAEDWGYSEVNLNVGCPSDRVQKGRFGACLMAEPELVRDCIGAMIEAVDIPVTVKCRIGIDREDAYEPFANFIDTVAESGCRVFIVHARKAWLDGLSPKQNREVPPLRYEYVYRLKQERPDLTIVINGGIDSLEQCQTHLAQVDGVMLGRAAYQTPYLLAAVDRELFGKESDDPLRHEVIENLLPYIEQQMQSGVKLMSISRHILNLYKGQPGGKRWRRHLSENAKPDSDVAVLLEAIGEVSR